MALWALIGVHCRFYPMVAATPESRNAQDEEQDNDDNNDNAEVVEDAESGGQGEPPGSLRVLVHLRPFHFVRFISTQPVRQTGCTCVVSFLPVWADKSCPLWTKRVRRRRK